MKIKIYRDAIDPDDLDALIKLVEDAGHEAEVVDGLPGDDCASETLIVVIRPDDESLSDKLIDTVASGGRGACVVGVWPKGATDQPLPDYFDDHGTGGSCVWDPAALNGVLKDPKLNAPGGGLRPPPPPTFKDC